jgi:hypothetical protein
LYQPSIHSKIAETRSYIQDFAAAYETAKDAEGLINVMSDKYPVTAISGPCSSLP